MTEMKSAEETFRPFLFSDQHTRLEAEFKGIHRAAIYPAMQQYAAIRTEQALREFAERVKAGNDLYPELAESHCGCSTLINTSRVDAIRDSLLTEIRKGE